MNGLYVDPGGYPAWMARSNSGLWRDGALRLLYSLDERPFVDTLRALEPSLEAPLHPALPDRVALLVPPALELARLQLGGTDLPGVAEDLGGEVAARVGPDRQDLVGHPRIQVRVLPDLEGHPLRD